MAIRWMRGGVHSIRIKDLFLCAILIVAILSGVIVIPASASGDFNGEGHADLPIGIPLEIIGSTDHAGAVSVLYGDSLDPDNDGVPDNQDAFVNNPNEWQDTDGNEIGNITDTDDDNDGMLDEWEGANRLILVLDDVSADPDTEEYSNLLNYRRGTNTN